MFVHFNPPVEYSIFDISVTHREAVIQQDTVGDDLAWEAMASRRIPHRNRNI